MQLLALDSNKWGVLEILCHSSNISQKGMTNDYDPVNNPAFVSSTINSRSIFASAFIM